MVKFMPKQMTPIELLDSNYENLSQIEEINKKLEDNGNKPKSR